MAVAVGSEEDITREDKWIYKFSEWDLDDGVPGPSSSAPPPATDEIEAIEECEEEASDEDGEDDEDYRAEE